MGADLLNAKCMVGTEEYVIERLIGSGSFGDVYCAICVCDGSAIALKVEHTAIAERHLSKEYNLYRRMGTLDIIPRVCGYGSIGLYKYMALELCGPTLTAVFLAENCCFGVGKVLRIGMRVLGILRTLHELHIVHCDIKPDNFVVTTCDGGVQLKIIDFGLSRVITPQYSFATPSRNPVGTCRFMSISAHDGFPPEERDDLESTCYMLVYLLKGRLPWDRINGTAGAGRLLATKLNRLHLTFDAGHDTTGVAVSTVMLLSAEHVTVDAGKTTEFTHRAGATISRCTVEQGSGGNRTILDLVELMQQLVDRTSTFSTDSSFLIEPTTSDCLLVARVTNSLFMKMQLEGTSPPADLVLVYDDFASLITAFIRRIVKVFGHDGIMWTTCVFAKFIAVTTNTSLCAAVLNHVDKLLTFMDTGCRLKLATNVIMVWTLLRDRGVSTVSINLDQTGSFASASNDDVFQLQAVYIDVSVTNESMFVKCLLHFVTGCIREVGTDSEVWRNLWVCLFREFSTESHVTIILQIMNMLIANGSVDHGLFVQYCMHVAAQYRLLICDTAVICAQSQLDRMLSECLRLIRGIMLSIDTTHLNDVCIYSMLPLCNDLTTLINMRPTKYCAPFLRVVALYAKMLNAESLIDSKFEEFASQCRVLIVNMFTKSARVSEGLILPIFRFYRNITGLRKSTELVMHVLDCVKFNECDRVFQACMKLLSTVDKEVIIMVKTQVLRVIQHCRSHDCCIGLWQTFLESLDNDSILDCSVELISVGAELHGTREGELICRRVCDARLTCVANPYLCRQIDRAIIVLCSHNRELLQLFRFAEVDTCSYLNQCAEMLVEENDVVQRWVLLRMCDAIPTDVADLDRALPARLVRTFVSLLQTTRVHETRQLIGMCIGKVGAVDLHTPCALRKREFGIGTTSGISPSSVRGIDELEFISDTITMCAQILSVDAVSSASQYIGCALQNVLHAMLSSPVLDSELVRIKEREPRLFAQIEPFIPLPAFTPVIDLFDLYKKPVISHTMTYHDWIWQLFYAMSLNVKCRRLSSLCNRVVIAFHSGDDSLPCRLLPRIIVQSLIDNNEACLQIMLTEIHAVFDSVAANNTEWVKLACYTCFGILDAIEKFCSSSANPLERTNISTARRLLSCVFCRVTHTQALASVHVALKCRSYHRALRWLEQYGMPINGDVPHFTRDSISLLEQIYFELGDTDGVSGAFQTIKLHAQPSIKERGIALESIGEYANAVTLYQSSNKNALATAKCLIKLNQPRAAYTITKTAMDTVQGSSWKHLQNYNIQSACMSGDPGLLAESLKSLDANNITSWTEYLGFIFIHAHNNATEEFRTCVRKARSHLVNSLEGITMEANAVDSEVFRYVIRLHILFEVEEYVNSIWSTKHSTTELLDRWAIRARNTVQSLYVLEAVFNTRRQLLRMHSNDVARIGIYESLLDSCRIARFDGADISRSLLEEARALNFDDVRLDIETAHHQFAVGEQRNAVFTLKKALKLHFPELVERMDKTVNVAEMTRDTFLQMKGIYKTNLPLTYKLQTEFVNGTISLAHFLDKCNVTSKNEVCQVYNFACNATFCDTTELQAYKFAVFYDTECYIRNRESVEAALFAMQLYAKVSEMGTKYILHALPRMLAIWQEYQNLPNEFDEKKTAPSENTYVVNVRVLGDFMLSVFNRSNYYSFFIAVYRGKFSEGIDFANDLARCVICVGVPYPNPTDPVVRGKQMYNDRNHHLVSGKEWYAIQTHRALNQAIGRCLRHSGDWGAVLLVDCRYIGKTDQTHPDYDKLSKLFRACMTGYESYENTLTRLREFVVAHA